MDRTPDLYRCHRFPGEIIGRAVWLYHCFGLSFRDVELLLAERGGRVMMLWQHDPGQPIGVWDEVREDGNGLWVKGRILPVDRHGSHARRTLSNSGASVATASLSCWPSASSSGDARGASAAASHAARSSACVTGWRRA